MNCMVCSVNLSVWLPFSRIKYRIKRNDIITFFVFLCIFFCFRSFIFVFALYYLVVLSSCSAVDSLLLFELKRSGLKLDGKATFLEQFS